MKYTLLMFTIILCSCSINNSELKEGYWKYGGGYYIGDFISFEGMTLKNDTIFNEKKPFVILVNSKDYPFVNHEEIEIKSLTSDESGFYYMK